MVNEHQNISIAGQNWQAGYATVGGRYLIVGAVDKFRWFKF